MIAPASAGAVAARRPEPGSLPVRLESQEYPYGRTNMAELVRGDGAGFLAGSLVAVLAVSGIFFLTLVF